MRHTAIPLFLLVALAGSAGGFQEKTSPTMRSYHRPDDLKPATADGIVEMWRRGFCTLSTIHEPAKALARKANAVAAQANIPLLPTREFKKTNPILSYAIQGATLWIGTDAALIKIDTAAQKVARTFTKADGLPDGPITNLAPDGDDLWLLTTAGIARVAGDTITAKEMPKCSAGMFAFTADAAWLVAETGLHRFDRAAGTWKRFDAPFAETLTQGIDSGIWNFLRRPVLARLFQQCAAEGKRIWFLTMGNLWCYDIAAGTWMQKASGVARFAAGGGSLWALTAKAVVRFDDAVETAFATGKELPSGIPFSLTIAEGEPWIAIQSQADETSSAFTGGGVARYNSVKKSWETFTEINGTKIFLPTSLGVVGGDVVVAAQAAEKGKTVLAHPGMAHIKQVLPDVTALAVHRYDRKTGKWASAAMPLEFPGERCIVGEWGTYGMAKTGPLSIDQLAGDGTHIFATYKIKPRDYYAGFYPTVGRFAVAGGAGWKPSYENHEVPLHLAGEEPDLLMIALSHGRTIVQGEGQYSVLGLETIDGVVWTIHEGAAACFTGGAWKTVFRSPNILYWNATAAAVDGEHVWFGCDREIVARYHKPTGQWSVVGRVPGRSVTAIRVIDGKPTLFTAKYTEGCLPPALKEIPVIGEADVLTLDGGTWKPAEQRSPPPADVAWSVDPATLQLSRGGKTRGVVPGVFRPVVLCADETAGAIWIATYEGVVRVDIKE